jgi:hypothetical protein
MQSEAAPAKTTERSRMIKTASMIAVALVGVAALATVALLQSAPREEMTAAKGATALKYGMTVAFETVYNDYITVSSEGRIRSGAYHGDNDNIKLVSPKGKKGAINYGDSVVLMGTNGKYFLVRYSGQVVCRANVISAETNFKMLGGSGPVQLNDVIMLKSEFGYLTVSPDGSTSLDQDARAIQKLVVALPGQETGLKLANGIHYGNVVKFQNLVLEFMICDRNGWITMSNSGTSWDHFVVISDIHREGLITFGDSISLRAHNGRMISVRSTGELEAVSESLTDTSNFKLLGTQGASSGVVHSRDFVILKTSSGQGGFVDAMAKEHRVAISPSGHDSPSNHFQILKVWESTL